ncbi:MAG: excinuclease subunit, partial [Pseudomonadota bacterium]
TLYAEGQRRYVESLSAYARQFLQLMEKPDVDLIEGLSPAISIEQKATSHNPRSTVGTVTEIHDYLRLLYARVGTPYCPDHPTHALQAQSVSQMVDHVLALPEDTKVMILAPAVVNRKGEHADLFAQWQGQGFVRFRIRTNEGEAKTYEVEDLPKLDKKFKHSIDIVIDRLKVRADAKQRLAESFETALRLADGRAVLENMDTGESNVFSNKFACPVCGWSLAELEPRLFSFNNPVGACPTCDGLGTVQFFDEKRVVAFPSLSLASGAIKGWDRRNNFYFSMLESLAKHYDFDVDTPFEALPDNARHVVLHGSGKDEINFVYVDEKGRKRIGKHTFEGILNNLDRRYKETDSVAVREELAKYIHHKPCPSCHGARLNVAARFVRLGPKKAELAIYEIASMTLAQCHAWFDALKLTGAKREIAERIIKEIATRLKFLNDVGLNYLSLDRSADTLSGGEAQRIRLASQIGSGLTGVMYVLDEPSIGLHQRDNDRLIGTLKHLRDIGNSVLVVEHDEDMIRQADHVIDMGPGAGEHGGRVLVDGTPAQVEKSKDSITGKYLARALRIDVPTKRHAPSSLPPESPLTPSPASAGEGGGEGKTTRNKKKFEQAPPKPGMPLTAAQRTQERIEPIRRIQPTETGWLRINGAKGNNLKNVTLDLPVGLLVCVTGVSGSGKSTLINETLYTAAARAIYNAHDEPAAHDAIEGLHHFDKVVNVDQGPIGRTPRSNPATYTGLFAPIRELFAGVPQSRERGYEAGRFSFNVKGGRCEACQGDGVVKVEMHFLPDMYVPCDVCHGKRYNRETLEIMYRGKNIADVLGMRVSEAFDYFEAVPAVNRKLQTLLDVGLGYITLGQSATTLSGGEAQRVKLSLELSKRDTGRTLYVLDEPTTGLHFHDNAQLLKVIHTLRDAGNTVVVIEHNLDVIKTADWVIDLGPEGGAGGGQIIAAGTPEEVAANQNSYTGRYLAKVLEDTTAKKAKPNRKAA